MSSEQVFLSHAENVLSKQLDHTNHPAVNMTVSQLLAKDWICLPKVEHPPKFEGHVTPNEDE